MLKNAKDKVLSSDINIKIKFIEMGIAELDGIDRNKFDSAIAFLLLSELSNDEISFTLNEIYKILKPGGTLFVADESIPENLLAKYIIKIIRFPLKVLTWILTGNTTKALSGLQEKIELNGLKIESKKYSLAGNFIEITARKKNNS